MKRIVLEHMCFIADTWVYIAIVVCFACELIVPIVLIIGLNQYSVNPCDAILTAD